MTDLMTQLGPLAVGSRLKRMSDAYMKAGTLFYEKAGVDFETRSFTLFYLLTQQSPLSVMECAEKLGISHPAVIALARDLETKGLIQSEKSDADARKRWLSISEKGRQAMPNLQKLWSVMEEASAQLIQSRRHNLLIALEEMENGLAEQDLFDRFQQVYKKKLIEEVEIIDYAPQYQGDFARLNYAWIEKFFKIEDPDRKALDAPEEHILDPGGYIFLARADGQIVGAAALINEGDGHYELAKMAVDEAYQGRQIGKKLCLYAIEQARNIGARELFLGSNTKLVPAIQLYKSVGFYQVENRNSPYARANIRMAIDL